jgi:hypothetical protein
VVVKIGEDVAGGVPGLEEIDGGPAVGDSRGPVGLGA